LRPVRAATKPFWRDNTSTAVASRDRNSGCAVSSTWNLITTNTRDSVRRHRPLRTGGTTQLAWAWNNGRMSSASPSQPNSPLRARITKLSYPAVAKLHTMPKLTLPGITLVLALVGVLAPVTVGVVALILLALLLGWLGFLSWPVVTSGQRAIRVFTVLVILFFAVSRIAGR
jgi:hypothetical protein